MKYPNPNMLLYIAMGDAYVLPLEFAEKNLSEDEYKKLQYDLWQFQKYYKHSYYDIPAGNYTDDTEMSVANTKALLDYSHPFTAYHFTNFYFKEFYLGGQRLGYAEGFYNLLKKADSGMYLLMNLIPNSEKNGAAMRAVPIGVLPNISQVLHTATIQGSITHNTNIGLFSARAVALMSHFALYYDDDFSKLKEFCLENLPIEDVERYSFVFTEPWPNRPIDRYMGWPLGITTVHAVFHLLTTEHSLKDIMTKIILWGGDTDSVAAIAWGIFSTRHQDEVLPTFLIEQLEGGNEKTGAKYLKDLGEQLMVKYAK